MKYEFIAECAQVHNINIMCQMMKVSRSGYYSFAKGTKSAREQDNKRLLDEIRTVHAASRETYGSPRVFHQLKAQGVRCGRHRVARLMANSGIQGKIRRRFRTTTRRNPKAHYRPDKLQRNFVATRPHQVWMSDITYLWTEEGWLYLAVVIDLFSRMVVGWSTGARIEAELVCRGLNVALVRHKPTVEVVFHSDKGSQYTSEMLRELLENNRSATFVASHGSSCYDNAVVESFFHTLKSECPELERSARARDAVHESLFDYIEIFYNRKRLHSSIGYLTPLEKIQSYEVQENKNLNSLSEETGQ